MNTARVRRIVLATLIGGASLVAGTSHDIGAANPTTDAELSIGDGCTGSQAHLIILASGGSVGQTFDLTVDGSVVDTVGPNSYATPEPDVSDGVHTIGLVFNGDVIQEVVYAVSCGDPVIAVAPACDGDSGILRVSAAAGTAGDTDMYLDGDLFIEGFGNYGFAQDVEYIPDGTYEVAFTVTGQASPYVFEDTITVDCAVGSGAKPAYYDVQSWCDDPPVVTVELISFTYGERFNIDIDGVRRHSNVFAEYYEMVVSPGGRHVVVTNNLGRTVYDDYVLVACGSMPAVAAKAVCTSGTGTLYVKTADTDAFTYDVSVDGVQLAGWNDAPSTDGQWESLGVAADGLRTVLVEWSGAGSGSTQLSVDVNCLAAPGSGSNLTSDSGSGAGTGTGLLQETGSETGPMLLIASLFVAVGAALLASRRTRTA